MASGRKKKEGPAKGDVRLSQEEILQAIQLFLRKRGDLPSNAVGYFRWRFGMVGEPQIMLIGDACEIPDAGDVYLDWSFEELTNVAMLPKKVE